MINERDMTKAEADRESTLLFTFSDSESLSLVYMQYELEIQ